MTYTTVCCAYVCDAFCVGGQPNCKHCPAGPLGARGRSDHRRDDLAHLAIARRSWPLRQAGARSGPAPMSRPTSGSSIPVSPSRPGATSIARAFASVPPAATANTAIPTSPPMDEALTFHAQTHFADVLVGYQTRFGELTGEGVHRRLAHLPRHRPVDEETLVIGSEVGVKGVLEFWLNMGQKGWGSLDLSWASALRDAIGASSHRLSRLALGLARARSRHQCRFTGRVPHAGGGPAKAASSLIPRRYEARRPARLCAGRRLRPPRVEQRARSRCRPACWVAASAATRPRASTPMRP